MNDRSAHQRRAPKPSLADLHLESAARQAAARQAVLLIALVWLTRLMTRRSTRNARTADGTLRASKRPRRHGWEAFRLFRGGA